MVGAWTGYRLSRHRPIAAVALLLLWGLSACTAPGMKDLRLAAAELPQRAQVSDVPFFPQTRYHCGPAAMAMALAWTGLPVTQDDMTPQVYTPGRTGTLQADLLGAARRNGRLAVVTTKLPDLLREVAAGHPVLVFQNLALEIMPQWHYAILTGYDLETENVFLHSGTEKNRVTPINTFAHTWARAGGWALVVLPPDKLPISAGEIAVMRAAAGLERAGRKKEAARAYAAIRARWPNSFAAAMGAGNTRYALGEFDAALKAFAAARDIRPKAAPAWNNLAHALIKLGRRDDAIEAARRAVSLAGANGATYRETLAEISAKPS